jgi:hypothetical protein
MSEEYQDEEDIADELQEAQQESYDTNYAVPKPESNLYNLFWKVNETKDSTKVANLNKEEIGNLNISVRDAQKVGMLGHIFHHKLFGDFFFSLSEITSATSMASKGWFAELFVSQKKFQTRARKSSSLTPDKWKMFQKKQTTLDQPQQ